MSVPASAPPLRETGWTAFRAQWAVGAYLADRWPCTPAQGEAQQTEALWMSPVHRTTASWETFTDSPMAYFIPGSYEGSVTDWNPSGTVFVDYYGRGGIESLYHSLAQRRNRRVQCLESLPCTTPNYAAMYHELWARSSASLVAAEPTVMTRIQRLQDMLGVDNRTVAKLLGIAERTVFTWRAATTRPRQRNMARLSRLEDVLSVIRAWRPLDLHTWLRHGEPSPLQLLEAEAWDDFKARVETAAERRPARIFTSATRASPGRALGSPPPEARYDSLKSPAELFALLARSRANHVAPVARSDDWKDPEIAAVLDSMEEDA